MTITDLHSESELHQIGAVAERTGLSLRTIRHWDEVGLVVPSGRSGGGFRLYTDADIAQLMEIKAMKPLGFSLEETAELLELRGAARDRTIDPRGLARLGEFAERSEQRVQLLRQQLDQAGSFTAAIRDELDRSGLPWR